MSYRLCFLATIIVGIACDQPCVPLLQFANAVRHTSASLFLALPSSMKCCPATPVVLQHNMGLSKASLPHCMTLSPCIVTLLNRLDSAVISSGHDTVISNQPIGDLQSGLLESVYGCRYEWHRNTPRTEVECAATHCIYRNLW